MAIEEIEIEGYVAKEPTYSYENHPGLLTFSVGVTQYKKKQDSDEWETSATNWYNVSSWNQTTSERLVNNLHKGDKVVVKGKPRFSAYINKDSEAQVHVSINLEKIVLLPKTREDTTKMYTTPNTEEQQPTRSVAPAYKSNFSKPKTPLSPPKARDEQYSNTPFYDDEIPF